LLNVFQQLDNFFWTVTSGCRFIAINNCGLQAIAIAIMTRCFLSPEISWDIYRILFPD
jgi:hypothetical protein